MVMFQVLNPCGAVGSSQGVYATRLPNLAGKTIGMLSNKLGEADRILPFIRELLQKQFPTANIIPHTEFPQGGDRIDSTEIVQIVKSKGCQAVIVGNAQWGSCTTKAGRSAARLEKNGIPSFVVTRKGFAKIVDSAFAGMGFPADAPYVLEFPLEMFVPGSDLSPLEKNLDKIVFGLTAWKSKLADRKGSAPPPITIEGTDYPDALNNLNLYFLRNLWSDGLPLTPATSERVAWILTGTDLPRDKILGAMLPRAGIVTVEQIAVSLAMAGGRPEYLPVLIAIAEAFLDPAIKHEHLQTTTGNNFPAVIVNGAIAKQIRLNSGSGCCGPDPTHPAGGVIGRALRLMQMNVGGALPGQGTMAEYGANRFTNMVIAENEDALPAGWQSLSEERGFTRGSNTVTLHFVASIIDMIPSTTTTEQAAMQTLNRWAAYIGCPFNMYWGFEARWENGSPGVLLMGALTAQGFAKTGFSKARIREWLWEKSQLSPEKVKEYRYEKHIAEMRRDPSMPLPVSKTPHSLMIAIAGGAPSGHAYLMPNQGYTAVTKAIHLPANSTWDNLLKQAEQDLGPLPAN